jgi:hypothetical protein
MPGTTGSVSGEFDYWVHMGLDGFSDLVTSQHHIRLPRDHRSLVPHRSTPPPTGVASVHRARSGDVLHYARYDRGYLRALRAEIDSGSLAPFSSVRER